MKFEDILMDLKNFANMNKLYDVEWIILNESANLIIHMYPYDIVAKVAIYDTKNNAVKDCILREIAIANYLKSKNVPTFEPTNAINSGPHEGSNHWFSLWKYEKKIESKKLSAEIVLSSIKQLESAMVNYHGRLPILGVWNRVQNAAARLEKINHYKYNLLIDQFRFVNNYMVKLDPNKLVPSHGDAHIRNLFPSMNNWLWTDFEDASLMPRYWDLASITANTVLFKGFKNTIFQNLIEDDRLIDNKLEFLSLVKARILMSIIGNLDMALQGFGDLDYANMQLDKFEYFLVDFDNLYQLMEEKF